MNLAFCLLFVSVTLILMAPFMVSARPKKKSFNFHSQQNRREQELRAGATCRINESFQQSGESKRVKADLISIVKQLQDGEDAGADEQTHLPTDITCGRTHIQTHREKMKAKILFFILFGEVFASRSGKKT